MTEHVLITPPGRPLQGRASPPGSKSLTNRALLLAALARAAEGGSRISRIEGALKSEDTAHMARALRAMGARVAEPAEDVFEVAAAWPLRPPSGPLRVGNAGTAMRFLAAAAALVAGEVVLDGDADMRRRPIGPLVAALQRLGVSAEARDGRPPVTVRGTGRLAGGVVEVDASASSQFLSAVLMIAPLAEGPLEVRLAGGDIGARGYVDMTLAVVREFGGVIEARGDASLLARPSPYRPRTVRIEPDASAAVYLWAAERLTGGRIELGRAPADFNQPDAAAWRVIQTFPDLPAVVDGGQMQDAVPALAVLAAFASRPVRFVNIANLRVKECDRITAVSTELNRISPGLAREEGDELVVTGDPQLHERAESASIRTYRDHRIAMSFALAALRTPGLAIEDPACTAKTWPGFWDCLASLGVDLRIG